MVKKARVAGVGMIPFVKPGQSDDWDVMGERATRLALADAGVSFDQVQQAYVGYVYGDSTSGQSALYRVGVTGIPIINVNNNCSTGSTALYLARQAIVSGAADCVLALGFEQMNPGALGRVFTDRKHTMEKHFEIMLQNHDPDPAVPTPAQLFGAAGAEYQKKYGASSDMFARISVKARKHAANNPLAIFRVPLTLEEVLASKPLYGPVTRLQACPPSCGAAAAVLVSPAFAQKHGLRAEVEIAAQAMTTDVPITFEGKSMISVVGFDMMQEAARQAYDEAGIGPSDVQVVELHDCFTPMEVLTYEALGLCAVGGAEAFIMDEQNTYRGRYVTNPSGGLLSKGHPLGATGLAQCYELTHQVRGSAESRQVDDVSHALQHNVGLGGACVVTIYGRA